MKIGNKKIYLISFLITAVFLAASLSNVRFFEFMELKALDLMFSARGNVKASPQIVIAAIDDKSLEKFGQWPWPREKLAEIVRALRLSGAKVAAFDIVFAEADRSGGDKEFAEELRKTPGSVLGWFFEGEKRTDNIPILSESAEGGYFNIIPDQDGIVRRMKLITETGENSLSLAAVSKYTGFTPILKKDASGNLTHIIIGDKAVPVDVHGRMMINYAGGPGTFKHVSLADILNVPTSNVPRPTSIVIIGATALGLSDTRATPFSTVHPGVEIHANIVDSILQGRYLTRSASSDIINIAILILVAFISAIALSRLKILSSVIFLSVSVLCFLFSGFWFFRSGIWLSVIYPSAESITIFMGITLYRYFTEGREKRRIHDAFKFYLAPAVINNLLEKPGDLKLGGESREITVLFSDVRNFTTISEKLSPEQLVELMNEYLTPMTDIIMDAGGMVDKYIGDAIMAIFGAPLADKEHAAKACRAALSMRARVLELKDGWIKKYGIPDFNTGIGLNTGPAVVGNMGSKKRFNYTAMGDTVNLASRLEGLTKQYSVPIIASEFTKNAAANFSYRRLDKVQVKGRVEPVEIFELKS